ncbi:MAG: ATP-binding protein [Chryseolinea sp.]
MRFNFKSDADLQFNQFSRLGIWYVLALSMIAAVAILGQVFIQSYLNDQLTDSHVVNIAGKQRMLSQKISKDILLLQDEAPGERTKHLHALRDAVKLFQTSQHALIVGNDSMHLSGSNSEIITGLFKRINIHYERISNSAQAIVSSLEKDVATPYTILEPEVRSILSEEFLFLNGMEEIVQQYDKEAQTKVSRLSIIEFVLLAISLLVIALEIIFIFKPIATRINSTIEKLTSSEKNSRKMANEISSLYASLEKSYEQISQINQPIENPRIYAKSDRGGNVTFISPAFSDLSGKNDINAEYRISDLFRDLANANDWMDEVIDSVSEGHTWKDELRFTGAGQKECWTSIIITPVYNDRNEIEELVVMGTDITKRKRAEQKINSKHQAEIDKKINQQKFRSVLILEGQEEERKRIAMDIHDGIGQMLTSLKYQVESVDLKREDDVARKLQEIDQLIKLVIKEVRKVTFNLKPTVLGDYGLLPALNVFVKEMSKLIDVKLVLIADDEIDRLPQKVENNIFRIIQEAINNAIKYSSATFVEVKVSQADNEIVFIVRDEGKGFDTRIVEERSVNIESGRGLFNMYERTEYINGSLDINSSLGKGTRVTLTVPISTLATIK